MNGALDQGLLYCSIDDIAGFSDADWAGGHNDQNSTSRHVFRMSFADASWKSKKQRCVDHQQLKQNILRLQIEC